MLPPLRGHNDWIHSVAFSPDGSIIISGSQDKTIRVWHAGFGVQVRSPLRGHDESIRSVAFSPDGFKIVSGSYDMSIRVWDPMTGVEMLPPFRGHDYLIRSVAFSPDGSKIISLSESNSIIRVLDADTGLMLPPQVAADDTPGGPGADELMTSEWLPNIDTGRYMGALPVGANFHCGQVHGSIYVGWTAGYKLVLVHFPE